MAKQYNVRLVIPLTDNWNYYHGGELTFCNWRGMSDQAQFYSDKDIIGDFKTYISTLLGHVNNYTGVALKDEPTILAWETGNELGKCKCDNWLFSVCASLHQGSLEHQLCRPPGRRTSVSTSRT